MKKAIHCNDTPLVQNPNGEISLSLSVLENAKADVFEDDDDHCTWENCSVDSDCEPYRRSWPCLRGTVPHQYPDTCYKWVYPC